MAAHTSEDERFWHHAIRRLALRIHLAWWLDAFLALCTPLALLGAVAILALRWWQDLPLPATLVSIAASLVLAGLAAAWLMRRHREPLSATRVRLEDALHLKSRLTAAAAGVGPWPKPQPDITLPLTYQAGRPLIMAALCLSLLAASLWIPVSRSTPPPPRVIEPPSALRDVQAWLDQAKKSDALNEDSIKDVEQKMAELLQRPAQNWYEHASLEAADHLREVTAQDLQQLAQNLADAERASTALSASANGTGLPEAAKDSLQQQLKTASESMQAGGMQPGGDLLDALKNIDPSQLASMSPDQLKDLAKQLSQNAQALQEALKNSPNLDLSNLPESRPSPGEGEGGSQGKGKPGSGGITRGPGTAPVTLATEDTQLATTQIESLQSPLDLQRLATGDALSVTNGSAKTDPKTYQGPQTGGTITTPGDGGSAIWQNTLIPSERETLKRFFK